ncbi:MAG: biosynthetic-type acetolactate synthase large subunit [Actinobacteria bacterium]|nr:biosynthetic-type acetolactate synthase large subunit [Actinomycetota bacterium]
MSKISGAQALIKSFENEGVKVIFGFPGGRVLPIYDVLFDSNIRHILVRHEQCAAHAADGYARATGKVGVCMATSGPGSTNLMTGIANAYMDSIPIVAITGQVSTNVIGTDAFQEADTTGISAPITKHNYLVKDARDLPRVVKEAFYIASTGRPGPVLIDIPDDVSKEMVDFKYPDEVDLPGYKPTIKGHANQIKQAASLLYEAKRPVILAGGGVISSNASEELTDLANQLNIPVTATLMGKGCFREDSPLSLRMPGMHGTKYANYALTEADLILAVGVRFDDRVTGRISEFASKAKIIHIDIDPAEIGKNVKVDVPIVGDAKNVLSALLAANLKIIEKSGGPDRNVWLELIAEWKEKYPLKYKMSNVIKPEYVIEQIFELTGEDAIVTTEVGQNQMWAAQYYTALKPRTFISSGGLGTMGFGFPAAIGAQFGRPDKIVFDIAGDGSFQMVSQELATAVINRLPVKVAIMNNGFLGMVRQWQELLYNRRYSHTHLEDCPDFVKLAEAYGAVGLRATRPEEVSSVLEEAIDNEQVTVIDFRIEREENVFPMVTPGSAINQMLEE